MMRRRDLLAFGSACLAAGGLRLPSAFAQQKYPERPIRLVIPFAPGGVTDRIGRLWVDKMKALLGPVFIENLGGGGGSVGGAAVARATPDGYTILLGSAGSQLIIPAAEGHAADDPAKDLELISIVVVTAQTLAVHPSVPAGNLMELAAYAKAGPGRISFGSAGAGTMPHLAGELFKSLTGARDIVHVPYKGGSQAVSDLISGHIPMIITSATSQMVELHRAGKVRMLAVTTPARAAVAPDIPTAIEAGLPGMIAQNSYGLFAPAGTPKEIVERISQATREAMADDELRQKLIAAGFEPYPDSTPQAARRFVEDEIARWTPVLKAIGLKLE